MDWMTKSRNLNLSSSHWILLKIFFFFLICHCFKSLHYVFTWRCDFFFFLTSVNSPPPSAHEQRVWPHAHTRTKTPQSRQSVRISISFNVTRPICFQKCCHTETSPLQNRAWGLGADSWDPGSLHGLFVQQNLLFCHSRPVTSEII